MRTLILCCALLLTACFAHAATRQDTLRGSNGRGRDWWDVHSYRLGFHFDTVKREISGFAAISFNVTKETHGDSLQIDLQDQMKIDSVELEYNYEQTNSQKVSKVSKVSKDGAVWWIEIPNLFKVKGDYELQIHFHGKPREAKNPPWDGGFIWTKDSSGKPWIAVACQGLGASSWWPCKDYQGDEPDQGMQIYLSGNKRKDETCRTINYVSNGRFLPEDTSLQVCDPVLHEIRTITTQAYWYVTNPINTYNATFYIGDYAHWHDTLHGEKGILDLDFYPLKYNEQKARTHWAVAKDMLRCYEYWLGPYPFYEDGYKLVEAPYLGMEHQSAVAYGNQYKMGYLGHDRSGSGVGLSFDFIIVHESGHEWFGNSITAQDIADNWIHEGFTTYCETLFAQWVTGKDSAFAYATGEWKNIRNDRPVIGAYGVNDDGSDDKYDKGAAVLHMIRMMLHNDEQFRLLLRGLNQTFYHKIVTGKEVETYISRYLKRDLKVFFDTYLRSTAKPVLEWYVGKNEQLLYNWKGVPANFTAPFITIIGDKETVISENPASAYMVVGRDARIKSCGYYDVVQLPAGEQRRRNRQLRRYHRRRISELTSSSIVP